MDTRLEDYLKSDRQWLRPQRLDHAIYQLKNSTTDADKAFWLEVVKANSLTAKRGK